MSSVAPAHAPAAPAGSPVARIGSLDVLRGIALLGMFLVHFNDQAIEPASSSAVSSAYQKIVGLFFEERFWTMFGILFGAGFAVQWRRMEARDGRFVPMYLRRLLTLALVGLAAHAVYGYHVLFEYAMWGLPLLLVRRWSTRALVVALIVSAMSWSAYSLARGLHGVAAIGEAGYRAELTAEASRAQAFRAANAEAQNSASYRAVFRARLQHIAWFYAQPFSFLPVNTFTLFLIGVIALRLGLFDAPDRHRLMIQAVIAFGIASWAASMWLLPAIPAPLDVPVVQVLLIAQVKRGFGLIRETWLSFAYVGSVLLLTARNPMWLRRLAAFGWTGRMALTNYLVQIAILDLLFSRYSIGLKLTPLQGLGAGLALFALNAAASRWWLSRFQFGPFEWIWRSVTYGARQPFRRLSMGVKSMDREIHEGP
jgi:uncharacterized protein